MWTLPSSTALWGSTSLGTEVRLNIYLQCSETFLKMSYCIYIFLSFTVSYLLKFVTSSHVKPQTSVYFGGFVCDPLIDVSAGLRSKRIKISVPFSFSVFFKWIKLWKVWWAYVFSPLSQYFLGPLFTAIRTQGLWGRFFTSLTHQGS